MWQAAEQIKAFLFSEIKAAQGLESKMPYHVPRYEEVVYEEHANQTNADRGLLHRDEFAGRVGRCVCAGPEQYVAAKFSAQSWMAQFFQPPRATR
jgi:hypothetical protein